MANSENKSAEQRAIEKEAMLASFDSLVSNIKQDITATGKTKMAMDFETSYRRWAKNSLYVMSCGFDEATIMLRIKIAIEGRKVDKGIAKRAGTRKSNLQSY